MKSLIKKIILNSLIFKYYSENNIKKTEKTRFIKEADEWLNSNISDNNEREIIRGQFVDAMNKFMFSFNEFYFQYDLLNKKEKERRSYISRSVAQKHYRKIVKPEWRSLFHNKNLFLAIFKEYIHRKYLLVTKNTPIEDVNNFLLSHACIIKPISGSLGNGIFKTEPEKIQDINIANQIRKSIYSTDTLIEECIEGEESLQKFHPSSLNTIRVVTTRAKGGENQLVRSFYALGVRGLCG